MPYSPDTHTGGGMASGGWAEGKTPQDEQHLLHDLIKRRKKEGDHQEECAEAGDEERTPEVQPAFSLPATLSEGEGVTQSSAKPWDKSNSEQQQVVSLSEKYKYLLNNKRSELTKNVQFPPLIPHLLQLDVLDKQTRDTIQQNATEAEMTLWLVDHLERGPCWRLHGFLRALVQTDQGHLVTLLGLRPQDYQADSTSTATPQKCHFYRRVDSKKLLPISNDLLPGLLQHCGSYNRTLMRSSIFGHKDTKPIDLTQVWVGTDVICTHGLSAHESIGKMEMFQQLFQRHPPNTVSLEGQAGVGKSAFVEDYAYTWSKDVTACEERGPEVACQGHLWKLVLYVPLGSISGTFTNAIRDSLKCDPDLQQQMMAEITRNGEGVLIIGDGNDELRDETSQLSLCQYTKTSQEMVTKPKLLITARDGLLSIPRGHFDRELHVQGFTLQQGVIYMGKYLKAMHQITEHPVLVYTQTHQQELAWVLTNPLQVHILSELAARDILKLDDMMTLTMIKLFRSLDHLMVTRDEGCRAVGGISCNFYKACFRCLLNNKRQVTEEEVGKGSPYLSLLTKSRYWDKDCRERLMYGFPHETLFEFFAMRGVIDYIKINPRNKKALLLYLCSKPTMQNVLRLTCHFLTQYERELFPEMVVAIIRCCLLLQTDIEPCVKNELTDELPKLLSQIQESFPRDLLSCGLTTEQTTKMDRTFELIQGMFTEPDDCLKKYGWAPTKAKRKFWSVTSPFHRFILTCVEQCSPADRALVLTKTTECLLPCATHDPPAEYVSHPAEYIGDHIVPVNGRFATIQSRERKQECTTRLFINIWCLRDLVPILHSHKQLGQLRQTDEHYSKLWSLNQCGGIHLHVNNTLKDLWGAAPTAEWSVDEWTLALGQLLEQYDMGYLRVYVNPQVAWSGLLAACTKVITHGHKPTGGLGLFHGKVLEGELLQFLDWACGVKLAVYVNFLTVVLAAGCDPEEWRRVDATIRQKADRVKGSAGGSASYITYVSDTGKMLCFRYST